MEKYAFIHDTNNDVTFYAKFHIESGSMTNYEILHIYRGDRPKVLEWMVWSLPLDLKMSDLMFFEEIPKGYMHKAVKCLFGVEN